MKHFKHTVIITLVLFGINVFGQTSDQTKAFFNRTHVALAKVEKEMFKGNDPTYAADLKKAVKYQVIAVNLYKQNKFNDAVGYSFKARTQCMEICTKMNIDEGSFYALNNEEKVYCNPNNYTNLALKTNLLNNAQIKQIDEVDVLIPAKFHELEINIKN